MGIKPLLWPCRLFPGCRIWKECTGNLSVKLSARNTEPGHWKKNQWLQESSSSLAQHGSAWFTLAEGFLIQQLHTKQNSKVLVLLFVEALSWRQMILRCGILASFKQWCTIKCTMIQYDIIHAASWSNYCKVTWWNLCFGPRPLTLTAAMVYTVTVWRVDLIRGENATFTPTQVPQKPM